jgi:Beta-galactosidase
MGLFKKTCLYLILYLFLFIPFSNAQVKTDLQNNWDTVRPLKNPHKGWYHHFLDNGVHKYLVQNDSILYSFPGMDHLYLRLAWAFLEPEEGKYNWSYIDNIVEKYVPKGYKISFRISCKETGVAPNSVPVEINGIRYATPYWVVKAGAKGIEKPPYGTPSWTPNWGDSIFLQKLENFHKAFAKKYDGKPWVSYIDIGSIGDWGEGHNYFSTRIPATVEEVKQHFNIHLKYYKKTQLIVSDDLFGAYKSTDIQQKLLNFAIKNSISIRDDSPMVEGYMKNDLATWTVRHPSFFEKVFKKMPTIFELEHYLKVKKNGFWLGKNGDDTIPAYNVTGASVFKNAVKIIKATYVGYHGYLEEWLQDNPKFTTEILNLCGYWYFPKSVSTNFKNGSLQFQINWLNKGVAPAYKVFQLRAKLIPVNNKLKTIDFVIKNSGNTNWMPETLVTQNYTTQIVQSIKGNYWLAIQLYDALTKKNVEIGLSTELNKNNYYIIQQIKF